MIQLYSNYNKTSRLNQWPILSEKLKESVSKMVGVSERIKLCRMIEKIEKNKKYADKLGIQNRSRMKKNEKQN